MLSMKEMALPSSTTSHAEFLLDTKYLYGTDYLFGTENLFKAD